MPEPTSKTRRARPEWLAQLEPTPGDVTTYWTLLVVHVAQTANESGFFAPEHPDWVAWSGLDPLRSYGTAEVLEAVGALERVDGRWYVVGWRENYRTEYRL